MPKDGRARACVLEEQPKHTVPAYLVAHLAQLVRRWCISEEELLAGSGITRSLLDDPLGRLEVPKMCELLVRARELTGEPGLGYYQGLQMRASGFGTLGFAALSAPTVREALELAVKFGPVFSTTLTLQLRVEGGIWALTVEENCPLDDARDMILISMMLGLQTVYSSLTGQAQNGAADLAVREPPYQPRFAHLVPKWRFGQPSNRLIVDKATLDLPIVTADPGGLGVAKTLCERAFENLGFDAGLVGRVRSHLSRGDRGFRSLDEVAARLHVSERTLKRHLAAQGVSFSALAERERRERALALLRSHRLSVADVAERLEYATPSSFVRAFHRWTGTTPAAYRRAHGY